MLSSLIDLITSLEWGTKLHISVVFLGEHGNEMTRLPENKLGHKTDICDEAKLTAESHAACVRCRNTVLKRVVRTKRPLAGCCINGIYEYCHPVVRLEKTVCVLFIGHILSRESPSHNRLYERFSPQLISTLQTDFYEADCRRTAKVIEDHILHLLDTYGDCDPFGHDLLIENIKTHIKENLIYDFSMAELAYFFGYNEKYLGRVFKARTGCTTREYLNGLRIKKASELLLSSDKKIADISGSSGFNNVTYFNRLFKRSTGLTPAEYRKRRK